MAGSSGAGRPNPISALIAAGTRIVALSDWLALLSGGLLHSNIGASALFAAVSGSSVATAATIATVALPAFRQRGYQPRLVLGTIAAGATLGILIPASINMMPLLLIMLLLVALLRFYPAIALWLPNMMGK